MKKFLFSLILLLVSYVGFSQKGLSYQAVILDPNKIEVPGQDISGQPLVNGDVWMKFSIYNGSTLQFEEVHKTRTDAYGLVNLMIGSVSTASFNALVWDSSQKSLHVYASFDQGGSYTKISEQKLTYNPYTLFAETAGKLGGVLGIAGGGTGATIVADARLNLGLDQVNNTSDAAKPVSTATQTALNLKANVTDVTSGLALKANTADVNTGLALKANTTDMTAALAAKADTGTIKSFVLTQVAAATIADTDASTKGKIQLAGDLAGTADAPTVPGLALKENSANKSTNLSTDGASDTKYPSVKSVKTYVDAQVSGATIADANATSKGKVQLAGDLAGTAAAPTVPGLALKENSANKSTNVSTDGASDSKYPSVKAVKSYVDAQLAAGVTSATIADADASTKGKIQLTGDLGGTAAAPTVPGLALKANATDVVLLTSVVNSNTASITANTSSIAGETTRATAAELTLSTSVAANTASITANTSSITAETTRATAAELALTNSVAANTASITANTSSIAGETTRATAAELALTNSVAANTASITANTSSITAETTRATAAELTLTTSVAANTASITANIAAIDLKAPIASPIFTGTLTAPIYATTPQLLTSGSTITWNPTQGLNASVTLDQNSTLSFSATPPSGSYGTLVVTQDGTGGRTITLPATANKVLGSTSTTSIALSTSAGAKDILNFYYDGTNCYWNIGQGYGTAATPASTNLANSVTGTLPVANGGTGATTLTGLVKGSGTSALIAAVAGTDYLAPNGSAANLTNFPTLNQNTTGNAATVTTNANLTGDVTSVGNTSTVVKINGTSLASLSTGILKNTTTTGVPTIAVAGTDYQAPISLTTTGTGSATLSGTTLNIPLVSSTVNTSTLSGTVALANGGTGQTTIAGIKSILDLAGQKVAIGATSGVTSQGSGAVAVGNGSGNSNQGANSIAIGYVAGSSSQGASSVAIGVNAGQSSQGANSVAIGDVAGQASQGANSVAIGSNTKTAANSVAIGYYATTVTYTNSTALGNGATSAANNTIQLGNSAITNVSSNGTLTAGTVTYPNTHAGTSGQVLTSLGSGTLTWTTPSSGGGGTHVLGEQFGGGIIFYISAGGFHGLIAAKENIGNTAPYDFINRSTDPTWHDNYNTTNGGNLFLDWRAPTYAQLRLLYNARNTTGLNLGSGILISSTNDDNDPFAFKCINFSNGVLTNLNGNWTPYAGRAIRSF
jgi:hypothetical protein